MNTRAQSPDPLAWPPGADEATYLENLRALAQVDHALAERLCWSVVGGNVTEVDGDLHYRAHHSSFPMGVDPDQCESLLAEAVEGSGDRAALIFGIGSGELVLSTLAAGVPVVAWDQDPWIFRLVLGTHDLTAPIRSGQLRLSLGTDLLQLLDQDLARLDHPLFERVYPSQSRLLAEGLGSRRALLCDGGLMVGSTQRALEEQGWTVWTADVERLSIEELNHTAEIFVPEVVVSINYRVGLSEFADAIGARLIVWEIDPTTSRPTTPGGETRHVSIFSYRKANAQLFKEAGYGQTSFLPLAADTGVRRPLDLTTAEREKYAAPISFVGASMVDSALENRARFAELHRAWRKAGGQGLATQPLTDLILTAQRQDFTRWPTPELLNHHAPGFADWCHIQHSGEDPAMLLGECAASEKRMAWVSALSRHDVQVWGDPGWRQFGAGYRGHATHHHDLTRVFNASTINLDIGRIYQTDIVTMRVFDVLACGGFALVEHSDGIEELFDVGRELDTYRTLAELEEKVAWYLKHPESTRTIAARGRAAVLERHTIRARIQSMLESIPVDGEALFA